MKIKKYFKNVWAWIGFFFLPVLIYLFMVFETSIPKQVQSILAGPLLILAGIVTIGNDFFGKLAPGWDVCTGIFCLSEGRLITIFLIMLANSILFYYVFGRKK